MLQNFALFPDGFQDIFVFPGQSVNPRGWTDKIKEAFNEKFRDILNLDRDYPIENKYLVIIYSVYSSITLNRASRL